MAILGSTGSIGASALDVLSRLKKEFEVVALSAGSNVDLLAAQAKEFRPKVIFAQNGRGEELKSIVPRGIAVENGPKGLENIVSRPDVDIVLLSISGTACIPALIKAVQSGKRIALANKEALVSAGPIIVKLAEKSGAVIIPVDSEHSAIFQCLSGAVGAAGTVKKIYLTGSGGPLLDVPKKDFDKLSRDGILNHPKWKMGRKISVDSATMMNKGLEIIEAQYLFNIDESSIEVLIHPEAIIHSMVEFVDGAVLAQLGAPDMRTPIQYAFTYPARISGAVKSVDFTKASKLSFRKPDTRKFPCLSFARSAAASGGTAPAALCAADEEAVMRYLHGKIKFSDIPRIIEKVMSKHKNRPGPGLTVESVLSAGRWAKEKTGEVIACYR